MAGWAFSGDRMGLASLESRTWSVERWVRNTRETQRNEEGSVWILWYSSRVEERH